MLLKMITGIFNFFISLIKNIFYGILNIPKFFRDRAIAGKNYILNFKYKLTHLAESNFELGIYHLQNHNLSDAIMRFKLVDRFLKPHDPETNYWLGVAYYLKNDIQKSLNHLAKAKGQQTEILSEFLKNSDNAEVIPFSIWNLHRDLIITKLEQENPILQPQNIINFTKIIINHIAELPDQYKILEIGSNLGLIGEEIKKRFPDTNDLIGVESSESMYKILNVIDKKNYNKVILSKDYQFLNEKNEKFDIVISCCGLSFSKDLTKNMYVICDHLTSLGYFVGVFRYADITKFSLEKKEFCYNSQEILAELEKNNLKILYQEKFVVEKNDSYFIVIAAKKGK